MKFSSVVVSLVSLGTVAAKKHGLRALMEDEHERVSKVKAIRSECMEYFTDMDVDEDDVLSIEDLKTVVTFLMNEEGKDEAEVRKFADDMADTDANNDGQVDKLEFMNACAGTESQSLKDGLKKKKAAAVERAPKKDAAAARAIETECRGYFSELDLDADHELSFDDLQSVVKGLINDNMAESEVRQFADDLSAADFNDDGAIQFPEFMAACTKDKDAAEPTHPTAAEQQSLKDHLLMRAEKKKAAAAQKKAVDAKRKHDLMVAAEKKKAAMQEQHEQVHSTRDYTEEDVKECEGYFKKMDIDNDGTLSLHDLKIVIDTKVEQGNTDEAELQTFVSDLGNLDINNDELIDANEFMSACVHN